MNMIIIAAYILFVIFLFCLLTFFILYLLAALVSASSSIPYVGTRFKRIEKVIKRVKPKKGQTFIDLGSGDGRIVFIAAQKFNLNAVGVEFNPMLTFFSRWYARLKHIPATFRTEDILKTDISKADIIYCFLLPKMLVPLTEKLKKEGKKGSIVISHGFEIKALKKLQFDYIDDNPFPTYYYKL